MTQTVQGQVNATTSVDPLAIDGVDHAEQTALKPAETSPASPSCLAFLQLSGGATGQRRVISRTQDEYLYSVRESVRICVLTEHSRMPESSREDALAFVETTWNDMRPRSLREAMDRTNA